MAAKFLVVVAFLLERDGCLLMLRRSATKDHAPGEWEPGSGRVETGLEVEVLGVVAAAEWVPFDRIPFLEVSGPLRARLASLGRGADR